MKCKTKVKLRNSKCLFQVRFTRNKGSQLWHPGKLKRKMSKMTHSTTIQQLTLSMIFEVVQIGVVGTRVVQTSPSNQ